MVSLFKPLTKIASFFSGDDPHGAPRSIFSFFQESLKFLQPGRMTPESGFKKMDGLWL
jgi:hypothetical protein